MTAQVTLRTSHNLPLPGTSGPTLCYDISIRMNLIIDRGRLDGVLTPNSVTIRGHQTWGFFSFTDSRASYMFTTTFTARMGNENEVTAFNTFVTHGNGRERESYVSRFNDRISHCRKRRGRERLPGMRVETDVIWLYDYPGNPGVNTLEHEIGHGLGIAHTSSVRSVMSGVAPRGSDITESDARCIIEQLDFSVYSNQIIDSDAIGEDTESSPVILRAPSPRSLIRPPDDH